MAPIVVLPRRARFAGGREQKFQEHVSNALGALLTSALRACEEKRSDEAAQLLDVLQNTVDGVFTKLWEVRDPFINNRLTNAFASGRSVCAAGTSLRIIWVCERGAGALCTAANAAREVTGRAVGVDIAVLAAKWCSI